MINDKKQKRWLYFFLFSYLYCLISSWFNGWGKWNQPMPFFFHFLSQWCVWISLTTIIFALWRLKRPKTNTYSLQVFSLIVMISNIIAAGMFALGLIVWGATGLTTHWGFTSRTTKIIPLPDCSKTGRVIGWMFYSPFWHLVIPVGFIYYYFCYEPKDLVKKKLKLTFFLCLIQPAIYCSYCLLRTKLLPQEYLKTPFSRWPLAFFSAKKMLNKWGVNQDYRLVYKIGVLVFCSIIFGLVGFLILKFASNTKSNYSVNKKVLNNSFPQGLKVPDSLSLKKI